MKEYTYRVTMDVVCYGRDEKDAIVDLYDQLENLDAGEIIREYATLKTVIENVEDERENEEFHA
jgi:hypothetical protein